MSGKKLDKAQRKQALRSRKDRKDREENVWGQLKENR